LLEEVDLRIGVPKEVVPGERRVAIVPDGVAPLLKAGLEVLIEVGAGEGSSYSDAAYERAGARMAGTGQELLGAAEIVAKVQKPAAAEVDLLREGTVLVAFLQPAGNEDLIEKLAARRVTTFAMEFIPRISRAQSMDALSSQANIAGYKAVLLASAALPKFFPMLMTAAGTIAPAKVLALGAGVAGLQAIATARRLGAQVWGYDVRPAVKEQVESLGAKFLEFQLSQKSVEDKGGYAKELSDEDRRRQQEWLADQTKEFDVVITTALIPGKPAPTLVTEETVSRMRPGSVIVDLAAEAGGNCELTEPGRIVEKHGVTIHGPTNLPSTVPVHASQLYSRNITELLKLIVKDGKLNLDFNDPIINEACVTHEGKVRKS
jgi:NAD(P) transhydrogenase subunit alpha